MPQTTNFWGLISGSPRFEFNTNGGSAYTDATGEIISITLPDNERRVGEASTLDGDLPIIAPGKISAGQMRVRGIYTGASSGFWVSALNAYQNGTAMYFRFFPAGSASGRYRFSSGTDASGSAGSATGGACYVQNRPVGPAEADGSGPYTYEISIMCPGFTGGAIP